MTVFILAWFERHDGISPGSYDVYATKEAAMKSIADYNATGSKASRMVEWDSKYNRENVEGLVAAWSSGQWYAYLTEHGVQA